MPTSDQKFVTRHSKAKKWLKAKAYKIASVFAAVVVPAGNFVFPNQVPLSAVFPLAIVGLVAAYCLRLMAAKVYGPDLGQAPGRARKADLNDLKKAGLV